MRDLSVRDTYRASYLLDQHIEIESVLCRWHKAMLRRRLEIDAFTLSEMILGVADVRLDFTLQDENELFTGMGNRVWLYLAFAPIDQNGLHLLIEKVGSHSIDRIAFVGGCKCLWAMGEVGCNGWLPIFAILHQSRYAHAKGIGDLRERRQCRHDFAGFDLGKQAFGTITGPRHFFQGSPLLGADAANPDANVQGSNSLTTSRDGLSAESGSAWLLRLVNHRHKNRYTIWAKRSINRTCNKVAYDSTLLNHT